MAVAAFDAGEFFVGENEQGIVATRQEFDSDEGFIGFEFAKIWFAAIFFPSPGEDEPFGWFDFAIGPRRGEEFTIGLPGLDAIFAANAWIAFGRGSGDIGRFFARHKPLFDLF